MNMMSLLGNIQTNFYFGGQSAHLLSSGELKELVKEGKMANDFVRITRNRDERRITLSVSESGSEMVEIVSDGAFLLEKYVPENGEKYEFRVAAPDLTRDTMQKSIKAYDSYGKAHA